MPAPTPPFKRLLSKYVVNQDTGCWDWTGSWTTNGYGQIKVFGRMRSAHAFSFELHKGPLPDGLEVLHQCDRKLCINPEHLVAGTHAQNMSEAALRGRMSRGADNPNFGKLGRRGIKSSQSIPVRVKGKVYGSKNDAERILGLGSGTVNYWIKKRPELAEQITREEYEHAE